jgi:vesicular inhibitory amino acid transporter
VLSNSSFVHQGFATVFYALIGMAGYLMFGDDVSEEVCGLTQCFPVQSVSSFALQVSRNLLDVADYNKTLNSAVLWMLVFASLTKFPLCMRPVSLVVNQGAGI